AKSVALMHKYVSDYEHILEKVFADPHLPMELASEKKAIYNYVYVKGGLDFIHLGMWLEGFEYLRKAFCMNPMRCLGYIFIVVGTFGYRKLTGKGKKDYF
ncbi:MAG: hypothetical protein LUQ50_12570, partial [Methanospirillum sp.]|uniref:hypothetical protein n=1 Tax=Methanospirillum sp. TaxID=45200 RepID=UPI00236FBFF8